MDVDIYQSAYSNARSFYSEKKVAAVKEIKSQNASKKAIMVAEKKIMEKLAKRTGSVPTITKARVPAWYEQFMWFITTENCLVIGSRDPIQCEQLLIKYFRDGDTLLTCDMDGSAICIVKKGDGLVGNATMLQAATMVVCSSKAWENKIVTSAYHLAFHQVSKIAHGQILPPGKFDIKGEKNWLPPVQTSYGIGLLWVIDDDSKTRHYDDRRPWLRGEIAGDVVPNQNEDDENESDKGGSSDQDVRSKDDDADGAESVEIETVHQIAQEEAVERTESPTDLKHDDGEAQEADHEDSKLNDNENEEMTIDASVSVVSNNEAAQDSEKGKKGGKLSAKQRKLLKKGKSIDEPSINQTQKVEVKPKETLKEAPAKLPRGQKNKMKKIKDKYGFQDEEEKFEKQIKANAKLEVLKEKIEEKNKPKPLNTEQRQKKDPFKVLEKGKSFEVPDVDVENLVGCPMEGDVLLACIPVSAPWLALQKFKYKIKVMPGSLKRGKACQQAQNAFSVMAKKRFSSEIESELMEHVPAKDWNDAMMSKAKLVISEKK